MKYYDALELEPRASAEDIKKAYRELAKRYHPDRNLDDPKAAEAKFKEISAAYAVLSDPEKKQRYDLLGDRGAGGTFDPSAFDEILKSGHLDDLLKGFGVGAKKKTTTSTASSQASSQTSAGGTSSAQQRHHQQQGQQQRQQQTRDSEERGRAASSTADESYDIEHTIEIGFMEAYAGSERQVTLSLRGGQKIDARIKIPPGINSGQRLRLKGQGRLAPDGTRGDVYLIVKVMPHPQFTREEQDVYVKIPVPFSILALGGSVSVSTPEGLKSVKVQAGTASGTVLCLRNLGAPVLAKASPRAATTEERGHLYVTLDAKIPNEQDLQDDDLRECLEKMKELGF
jgi:curved DNA-binding protein